MFVSGASNIPKKWMGSMASRSYTPMWGRDQCQSRLQTRQKPIFDMSYAKANKMDGDSLFIFRCRVFFSQIWSSTNLESTKSKTKAQLRSYLAKCSTQPCLHSFFWSLRLLAMESSLLPSKWKLWLPLQSWCAKSWCNDGLLTFPYLPTHSCSYAFVDLVTSMLVSAVNCSQMITSQRHWITWLPMDLLTVFVDRFSQYQVSILTPTGLPPWQHTAPDRLCELKFPSMPTIGVILNFPCAPRIMSCTIVLTNLTFWEIWTTAIVQHSLILKRLCWPITVHGTVMTFRSHRISPKEIMYSSGNTSLEIAAAIVRTIRVSFKLWEHRKYKQQHKRSKKIFKRNASNDLISNSHLLPSFLVYFV